MNATQLTRGAVKSCGCLRADFVRSIATKHSDCRPGHYTSEWYAWSSMRQRCINPKHAAYRDYGGRGITVCAAWTDSYEAFLADMGRKPTPKHTLDRIDVNAGYSPENCRWATWAVQQRNRRNNHMVEYRGKTMCVTDFATAIGMPASRVFARLRHGSDPESIAAAWLQVSPAEPAPTQEQPK